MPAPWSPASSAALQRLEVPSAVYAGIRHADMRDVRVVNAAGEFVPYALVVKPAAPPAATVFTPPVFALRGETGQTPEQIEVNVTQRADGSVVSVKTRIGAETARGKPPAPSQVIAWLVDLTGVDSNIAAIKPRWLQPPDNYIGNARVEASDDLENWRAIVGSSPLAYLSQGGARLTQDRIEFAPTRARYLRIGFAPAPPELAGIDVEAPRPGADVPRQSARVAAQPGANPGEYEFDLALKAPVDRVRIVAPEVNALAPVRLDARADARSEWRPVVSTVVYRMLRDGQELASPAVPAAPNPSARWRAVVDQTSGGLGRKAPELEVSWPQATLVFLARGSGPFALLYGARDAAAGALPIGTLVPGYREGMEDTFPVAAAGAANGAPAHAPSLIESVVGDNDPKKVALWAALIFGVLVLALMAWRLARQMR